MTRKEYNKCVDTFSDKLYGFALKNMKDVDGAQDIVQVTFEKLWIKHAEVEFEKAKSYLFSTAYHCIVDHFRKVKRMNEYHQQPRQTMEESHLNLEHKQWLEEGLSKMSEQERSLIMLRDYEGYAYDELSEMTGLTLSQVKVYLFRARKKFRAWLIQVNKINKVI